MKNLLLTFGLLTALLTGKVFGQEPPVKRTDLQRQDIVANGYETIQARIDLESGTSVGMHSHPGEEVIYVLEGIFEYQLV